MAMAAVSWLWATQTGWCEHSAGKSRQMVQILELGSLSSWRNGCWRGRWGLNSSSLCVYCIFVRSSTWLDKRKSSFILWKQRHFFSLSESVGLNIGVCDAGGQFVCEPRSGGFTWTDGVPAGLWLRYSALFLDATGLQWFWRGGSHHPWEVKPESRKSLD